MVHRADAKCRYICLVRSRPWLPMHLLEAASNGDTGHELKVGMLPSSISASHRTSVLDRRQKLAPASRGGDLT